MSAWYIFSAMGFYPMAPGSDRYELGSPAINSATLQLENGKTLTINTEGQGPKNVYVRKVMLNGEELKNHYITHAQLMKGGKLVYVMSSKPDKGK
jgi:putative alpha-1,2-mannosidase